MAGNALTMKEPAGRPVGRPRCMETQQTILAAAADLLESQPYRDISVERIAAQAGVGKQTIYRWYDSKADLMLDAFLARYAEIMPPAMLSGDPLANLRDYLHHLVEVLPSHTIEGGYRALYAEAQFDRNFRERFAEIVLRRRRDLVRAFIIAAVHKKQLRADIDPDILVGAILSPILMKFFATVELPDKAFADKVLDLVLRGAATKQNEPAEA